MSPKEIESRIFIEGDASLPITLVLMETDQLVGFVVLIQFELKSRPDLSWWVDALFVDSAFRGRGLGSKLLKEIEGRAVALGLDHLAAYTDQIGLYQRRGFSPESHELKRQIMLKILK